jgi:hypothetical protein
MLRLHNLPYRVSELANISNSRRKTGVGILRSKCVEITVPKERPPSSLFHEWNYEVRIRKLPRNGENLVEHEGMHVAKRMRKREVRQQVLSP